MRSQTKKWFKSLNSGIDAGFPSRNINGSSSPTQGNTLASSSHLVVVQAETDIPAATSANTINAEEQVSTNSPTLASPATTGGTTPLLQPASESGAAEAQTQLSSARAPILAPKAAAIASPNLPQSAAIDGWVCLKALLGVVDQSTGIFGPIKAVVDELVVCIEIYEKVANGRDEFKALRIELESTFENLQQHFSRDVPPTVTASMEGLCKSIVKELGYLMGKQDRSIVRRYLEAGEDADRVLACYRRIHGHLQRLSLNANLSMWKMADEQATDARLASLAPSLSACYNSRQATQLKRGACTSGTRIDVLGLMHNWVHDRAAGPVYWLNGMAGTGKTTIAYSLCDELNAAHNLGASFFCSRSLPECRDVNQIIPSIAYQLAYFSRPFRYALSRALEREPNVHTQLWQIQFEALFVKPLVEVREALPEDLVVVIDALDECDNKESTDQLLEALLTKTADLPVKFLITSRPEPEIRDQVKKQDGPSHRAIPRLVLHELDRGTVQGDIETYLRAALDPIKPSESQIAMLVQRAGILFIYAATVVRYIGFKNFSRNPAGRLDTILSISTLAESHTHKEIDELYTAILKAAIDDPELEPHERNDMKLVLNTVLCVREPLTIRALSGLLGIQNIDRLHAALQPLWSVLHVVESSELVTTLHASFSDYMFDPKRSYSYHCDPAAHEHILARCCFNRIKNTEPQFNVCGLESSYVLDAQVSNLSTRVEKVISLDLIYACQYWATHLERAKESLNLVELLEDFLSARLLLWIEILNLKNRMDVGVAAIGQAEKWSVHQACSEEITQLARDAWRFMVAFASSPVSQSTPHIYVSMLPFWPKPNPIAKHYTVRMTGVVPHGSAIVRRRLEHLATWSAERPVHRVAWSPNGTHIAAVAGRQIFLHDAVTGQVDLTLQRPKSTPVESIAFSLNSKLIVAGCDTTICIWNAQSGRLLHDPLEGHTESITSVAFSPDSSHIVSASCDETLRIWDVQSGYVVLGPLQGHTHWVASVSFSPAGTRIVSGSHDNTILVWDSQSGQTVLGPLEGHTDAVTSVAFSPDSTRIVSSSDDKTVRMWDAQNGQTVFEPIEGHTRLVSSVAFSPEGNHIVSGSYDNTICMWDAQSRSMVLGPLKGHTHRVRSIAFSPDGTRIVSGSDDKTIQVWDASIGQAALGTPELACHTGPVSSVAFSPDGTRIVSSASDNTIRVWDAQGGQMVLDPLKSPTYDVNSAAFSPDGTRIVSSSRDNTICVWDAQGGQMVLDPLKGPPEIVRSVAFSPDGARIVSGSWDNTMRVWDGQGGQTVIDLLEGYISAANSVAFSPDGTRIVSGSRGHTIRMWDAQSGKTVLGPLKGHTGSVYSVAFSPDGTRIVSGSDDGTIRIWDAQSGKTVLGPLKGHTGSVYSVAFSPDGTRIVSGSRDNTICVRDAQNGQMVLDPLRGHTGTVNSVAFSPDGTRIVSGSSDKTICVWDVQTEQTMTNSSGPHAARQLSWKTNPAGWVVDNDDETRLLVWVPMDLRPSLRPPSRMILKISKEECVGLNFFDAKIGESWTDCYRPVS